jgi:VanZ family protein
LPFAAIAVTLIVTFLFLIPLPPSLPAPGGLLGLPADALVHFLLSGLLAFVWDRGLARGPSRGARLLALWIAVTLYGAAIEWLQPRLSGRTGEWTDLLADGAGALAVLLLVRFRRAAHPARVPVESR